MLPFLKSKRQDAGISTVYRAPDDLEKKAKEDAGLEGLSAAADDLMKGIQSNDKQLVISALKAAFEILDSMPHDEGEHTDGE